MLCKALSTSGARAASLEKLRSCISFCRIFVSDYNCRRLNRLPSRWFLMQNLSSSSKSFVVFVNIMVKMLKRVVAWTQLWFYSVADREGLLKVTVASALATYCWMTLFRNFGGQIARSMIGHIPLLLTVSNALVRSTNITYSFLYFSRHLELLENKHHVCR